MPSRKLIAAVGAAALAVLAAVAVLELAERAEADPPADGAPPSTAAAAPDAPLAGPDAPALDGAELQGEPIVPGALEPVLSPLADVVSWTAPGWLRAAFRVPPPPDPVDPPRPPEIAGGPDLTERLVPPPLRPVEFPTPFPPVTRWRFAVPAGGASRVC